MKGKSLVVIVLAVAIALIGADVALAAIANSRHDLTSGSTAAIKADPTFTEICVFCHTPHNAITGSAPGWNRTAATENITYNTYTTVRGNSWTPKGPSKACLSCHDGTLGANSLQNPGFDGQPVFSAATEAAMAASPASIGQAVDSLLNDHPVGMPVPVIAGEYQTVANIIAGGLALYGASTNEVECSTCHDAHEYGTAAAGTLPFLAKSNLASGLCTSCHTK